MALVDANGQVTAVVVENGDVVAGAPAAIRMVTLSFLIGTPNASQPGGFNRPDGFRFAEYIAANAAFANRVDLDGDASGADDVAARTGAATFTDNGREQDALAEYLAANHSVTPYQEADTPQTGDTRIQNLTVREDTVLDSAPIFGDNRDNRIEGTPGNDTIDGRGGDDRIFADGGNDDIKGGSGDDKIFAGDGNDRIDGGKGDDAMFGGAGNDIFVGDLSHHDHHHGHDSWGWSHGPLGGHGHAGSHGDDDTYDGGAGIDTLDFSGADRSIEIDLGNGTTRFGSATIVNIENLIGGNKGDELSGNDLANELRGNGGDDELDGEKGNDRLFGGDGKDELDGGKGDDVLVGGRGKDTLTGGDGIDRFVLNSLGDGRDVIRDFDKTGSDKDQIVFAQSMFTGFAGDDGADLVAGGFLRARAASGGKTEVEVDADGGGNSWQSIAELSARLTSVELAAQVVLVQDPIV